MNKDLLTTASVLSDVERWLEEGKTPEEVSRKLFDIHLIVIPIEELKQYIRETFK